jgi:hypothetical protein
MERQDARLSRDARHARLRARGDGRLCAGRKVRPAGVELEPRDGWAQHSVAHVMEMQCRQKRRHRLDAPECDGWAERQLPRRAQLVAPRALPSGARRLREVLALFDKHDLRRGLQRWRSTCVDASALLWRLHLRGVDVGDRWTALAGPGRTKATDGNYAFNDMHAMMAFTSAPAGRDLAQPGAMSAQRAAMERPTTMRLHPRRRPPRDAKAIKAFGEGSMAQVVTLIRPVRSIAHRFGGSHAQRDVLDLT